MILSFGSKDTVKLWNGERIKSPGTEIQQIARRKLRMLNNSLDLADLTIPPANRLEKLKGKYAGFYSIRVTNQWRIIFRWNNGNARDVEFIVYH